MKLPIISNIVALLSVGILFGGERESITQRYAINIEQYNTIKAAIFKDVKSEYKERFEHAYPKPTRKALKELAERIAPDNYTENGESTPAAAWIEMKINGESILLTGVIGGVFFRQHLANERKKRGPLPSPDFIGNNGAEWYYGTVLDT